MSFRSRRLLSKNLEHGIQRQAKIAPVVIAIFQASRCHLKDFLDFWGIRPTNKNTHLKLKTKGMWAIRKYPAIKLQNDFGQSWKYRPFLSNLLTIALSQNIASSMLVSIRANQSTLTGGSRNPIWDGNQKSGINSPSKVGSLSSYFQGFQKRWWAGFLNHQNEKENNATTSFTLFSIPWRPCGHQVPS